MQDELLVNIKCGVFSICGLHIDVNSLRLSRVCLVCHYETIDSLFSVSWWFWVYRLIVIVTIIVIVVVFNDLLREKGQITDRPIYKLKSIYS